MVRTVDTDAEPWPLTTVGSAPVSPWRASLSCSPISVPREQPPALRLLLRRRGFLDQRPRQRGQCPREVRVGVREDGGIPLVHGDRNGAVRRDLRMDGDLQRRLDLALAQADLRVRAIE